MIYQVYFDDKQVGVLEPSFIPFRNKKCSVYFENVIIIDKIINSEFKPDEYFGVLSHNFRHKIETMKMWELPFKNIAYDQSYSLNWLMSEMEKGDDVICFMEHAEHAPVYSACKIHPRFATHWERLMTALGLEPRTLAKWEKVIYCNMFVAKNEVYKRYVRELLIPALGIMNTDQELWEDAKYPKVMTPALAKQLGVSHYTYHTFICERLFSYWYNFMYK